MKLQILGVLLLGALSACAVNNDPDPYYTASPPTSSVGGSTSTGGSGGTTASGSSDSSGSTTTTVQPMLVDVDTNQTMSATAGDGVGVFVEYKAGGAWHVWWTCDTNKSGQTCNFDVKLTATSALTDITTTGTAQASTDATGVTEFQTTTGASIDGVNFNTDAGGVLTLDASVGGLADGSFVFFVQDGKVNGGYAGKLTNPLKLEGSTP